MIMKDNILKENIVLYMLLVRRVFLYEFLRVIIFINRYIFINSNWIYVV